MKWASFAIWPTNGNLLNVGPFIGNIEMVSIILPRLRYQLKRAGQLPSSLKRHRSDSNRCTRIATPLPKPLGHGAR